MTKKRLYRNTKDKLLAGVLAGLADYFDQDVVLWRLAFIFFLILTGLMPGVLFYVVAWLVIPPTPLVEPLDESDYKVYS